MQATPTPKHDKWSKWLSGDSKCAGGTVEGLTRLRDTLLEKARIEEGMTLLDVGTGDGFVALAALDKLGPAGRVILSDISEPSLEAAQGAAGQMDALERCSFVKASADDLSAIRDESVDVVTTRSVLIFVNDKARALREFYRVLRHGGRISLFETVCLNSSARVRSGLASAGRVIRRRHLHQLAIWWRVI